MRTITRSFGVSVTVLAFLASFFVSPVAAATTYTLTPFTFVGTAADCAPAPAGTPGGVVAKFDNTTGNPAPSLLLAKNVPTTDCSAAGATVNGVSGITLTELNFDVMGYCGAGAPRFNVVTSDGIRHFFGCADGTQTPTTNGYTHVVFTPAQGFPPVTATETVKSIELIQDEQGTTHLDNISINTQVIGGPNTPKSANDCKNGGFKNLQDANGKTFKNQGQCVAFFNHDKGDNGDNGGDNGDGGNGHHGDNGDNGDNGQHGGND
ncbi:MAG: hypothetical protein ACR2JW_19980 [Thermomicrobiales bacterium]